MYWVIKISIELQGILRSVNRRHYLFGWGAVNANIDGRWWYTPARNCCPVFDIPWKLSLLDPIKTFWPFSHKLRCTWEPDPRSFKSGLESVQAEERIRYQINRACLVGCTRVAREDGLGQSRYEQAGPLGRCNQLCLVTVFNQSLAPHVCLATWAVGHSLLWARVEPRRKEPHFRFPRCRLLAALSGMPSLARQAFQSTKYKKLQPVSQAARAGKQIGP